MSNLSQYYADRIREVLPKGEENGITKQELMKRMNITDPKLMDSILKDVKSVADFRCKNGLYFVQDEMPLEYRDYIKKHFNRGEDIELRAMR